MAANITGRIEELLGEIEELSHGAEDVPASLLAATFATLDRAHRVLKDARRMADDDSGDPQPEVDVDMLDRMYRSLAGRAAHPEAAVVSTRGRPRRLSQTTATPPHLNGEGCMVAACLP